MNRIFQVFQNCWVIRRGILAVVVLMAFIVFGSSCGPSPKAVGPIPTKAWSAGDVRIFLARQGLACEEGKLVADTVYKLPSADWFLNDFPGIYRGFLEHIRLSGLGTPENDCDDHARAAALCANLVMNGMAVGEYWYHTRDGRKHAVNLAIVTDSRGAAQLVFWEPQTLRRAMLTTNEVQNGCIAWRM